MPAIERLFVTEVWRGAIETDLVGELEACCRSLAVDDAAGIAWSARHGYPGYTSYASLDDLPWRFPALKRLVKALDREVASFARHLEYDLQGRKLALDNLWVNVLGPGGGHPGHIHPHAVISGTAYVGLPKGASALKFEDPRLGFMMAQPARKAKAARERLPFVSLAPEPGTLFLWESWLRHEVPPNRAATERISVSFNYRWG